MPLPIVYGTAVAVDNTFVIVGGSYFREYGQLESALDTVFKYDAGNDTWEELPVKLTTPRSVIAATLISADVIPGCN